MRVILNLIFRVLKVEPGPVLLLEAVVCLCFASRAVVGHLEQRNPQRQACWARELKIASWLGQEPLRYYAFQHSALCRGESAGRSLESHSHLCIPAPGREGLFSGGGTCNLSSTSTGLVVFKIREWDLSYVLPLSPVLFNLHHTPLQRDVSLYNPVWMRRRRKLRLSSAGLRFQLMLHWFLTPVHAPEPPASTFKVGDSPPDVNAWWLTQLPWDWLCLNSPFLSDRKQAVEISPWCAELKVCLRDFFF